MMDSVANIIGWAVIWAVCFFVTLVVSFIVGNIYGGIKGSYRLSTYMSDYSSSLWWKPRNHWIVIRKGLKFWAGARYRDGTGTYYQVNGRIIPVDGRDPLPEPPEAP